MGLFSGMSVGVQGWNRLIAGPRFGKMGHFRKQGKTGRAVDPRGGGGPIDQSRAAERQRCGGGLRGVGRTLPVRLGAETGKMLTIVSRSFDRTPFS